MSEFIINNDQLERLIGAVEHDTKMPVNEVIIKGVRLSELVRCRDCKHYTEDEMEYYRYCGSWCGQVEPDGFCAWGERRGV